MRWRIRRAKRQPISFWASNGTKTVHDIQGIKKHFDDADLQPLLDSLKLNVRPQFVYQPMRLDDKVFGVVEIPIEKNMRGPYIPKQHHGSKIKKEYAVLPQRHNESRIRL